MQLTENAANTARTHRSKWAEMLFPHW